MPGPRPNPNKVRRNGPTIPETTLPATGRKGKAPQSPYVLGKPGSAWWRWAWKLPQADAWDPGALYAIGRRAALEDDLAALDGADRLVSRLETALVDAAGCEPTDDLAARLKSIDYTMRKLKSLAAGRATVLKEMRELDNRLGLNPKSMNDLRWSIEPKPEEEKKKASPKRKRRAVAKATGRSAAKATK